MSSSALSTEFSDVPRACKVLVVGGGPGGSFAASALAREGVDVVLLEADIFPRYHIGESMLPAMRHLLRFIDLDSTFVSYGFTRKDGAAFKLNKRNREGYTDFIAAGGPDNYAWNVLRSDADELLFRHAEASGAKVFDGMRVTDILFEGGNEQEIARPVSASFTRKMDARGGEISFEYIIDASGRAGLMSTKYLKNRTYNQSLKNVAMWGYWTGTSSYGVGTSRENSPFAEALSDESGWAWFIPLHIGVSVGIVMNQEISVKKKEQISPLSAQDFYLDQLKLAPKVSALISTGSLISMPEGAPVIRNASDYSYSSSHYGSPGFRIVGDAGAFIDPFFSSGVHLALSGGLSAAVSICAALRGDCSEVEAARWHSDRVGSSYTWFLMVVLGAYKQMRLQSEPVLADIDEDNFDRAFSFIQPIIQGSVNVDEHLPEAKLAQTIDLCSRAFAAKASGVGTDFPDDSTMEDLDGHEVLEYVNARKELGAKDRAFSISSFTSDFVNGFRPRLERGRLGLIQGSEITS